MGAGAAIPRCRPSPAADTTTWRIWLPSSINLQTAVPMPTNFRNPSLHQSQQLRPSNVRTRATNFSLTDILTVCIVDLISSFLCFIILFAPSLFIYNARIPNVPFFSTLTHDSQLSTKKQTAKRDKHEMNLVAHLC